MTKAVSKSSDLFIMAAAGSNLASSTLDKRLMAPEAELHVTMAPSSFASTYQEFGPSSSSKDGQTAFNPKAMAKFLKERSYATVPISIKPGSGENIVHLNRKEIPTRPEKLSSVTARLLDLQTLLEMPLAILGIQLKEVENDCHQAYLWPDKAQIDVIEVVRIPVMRPSNFSITATPLTPEYFVQTVWDFVQPTRNVIVIIHIQTISSQPQPSVPIEIQPLLETLRESSAPPRDSKFRIKVSPRVCLITGAFDIAEAAHIIPRNLNFELVDKVMELLFGLESPNRAVVSIPPLFYYRSEKALHAKMDEVANGIYLSPSLHRIFDNRRTIWILRQRCYILGPPVCYEELFGYDPPCPSLQKVRKIQNAQDDRALWAEQLLHEEEVGPLQCFGLSESQECLLHLSALLSFFILFMKQKPAMETMLKNLGLTLDPNEESREAKRSRKNDSKTSGKESRQKATGTTAAGGSAGGSSSRVYDQQQPKGSSAGWWSRRRPTSPPASNPPSTESSPSTKQARTDDNVAAPEGMKVHSTLTPANSDEDTETSLDPDLDSNSEEESACDEDEQRRRKLLHDNTLGLLFMKHTLTRGVRHLCV